MFFSYLPKKIMKFSDEHLNCIKLMLLHGLCLILGQYCCYKIFANSAENNSKVKKKEE